MSFDPPVLAGKYPSGKLWWGFNVTLPDGARDRSRFPTKREAEVHRLALLKQFGDGGGMTKAELLDAQEALYVLKAAGVTAPLTKVATHFLATSRRTVELTLAEYAADYQARKKAKGKAKKTLKEIKVYLEPFVALFGHQKPSEITFKAIERYLATNTSRFHRDKVLRGLFDWLAGKSKRLAALPDFPLDRSPFIHIERPADAKSGHITILYIAEVKKLITAAIGTDQLAWVVWGLFTGSRPEAEAKHMWHVPKPKRATRVQQAAAERAKADAAWAQVDLDERRVIITSSKLGGKTRSMVLQPNLVEWLVYFKAHGLYPRYSRCHQRPLWDAAFPGKADVQDILRHTAISNLVKLRGPSGPLYSVGDVAAQCGTSVKMIEKNYLAQISDPRQVAEFWSLKPASFGL